jgi:hypothetical protein
MYFMNIYLSLQIDMHVMYELRDSRMSATGGGGLVRVALPLISLGHPAPPWCRRRDYMHRGMRCGAGARPIGSHASRRTRPERGRSGHQGREVGGHSARVMLGKNT